MNWLWRIFRRQKPKTYWFPLPEPRLQVPLCPIHGRECGTVPNPFGPGRLKTYQPCPAWESVIERVELGQTREYFWNPTTEEFDPHPRR